jgi:transcriptional antiterminator NusG
MVESVPRWFVVHTYSGYEKKVKANLEKIIENRGMQEQILEVSVPIQNVVEIKNGTKKTVEKKVFPGYVLVFMHMNGAEHTRCHQFCGPRIQTGTPYG